MDADSLDATSGGLDQNGRLWPAVAGRHHRNFGPWIFEVPYVRQTPRSDTSSRTAPALIPAACPGDRGEARRCAPSLVAN